MNYITLEMTCFAGVYLSAWWSKLIMLSPWVATIFLLLISYANYSQELFGREERIILLPSFVYRVSLYMMYGWEPETSLWKCGRFICCHWFHDELFQPNILKGLLSWPCSDGLLRILEVLYSTELGPIWPENSSQPKAPDDLLRLTWQDWILTKTIYFAFTTQSPLSQLITEGWLRSDSAEKTTRTGRKVAYHELYSFGIQATTTVEFPDHSWQRSWQAWFIPDN